MVSSRFRLPILLFAAALLLPVAASGDQARKLFEQAKEAEDRGDIVQAYFLYAQAAVAAPNNKKYWGAAQAIKTKALIKAKVMPKPEAVHAPSIDPDTGEVLSETELKEGRPMLPPAELQGNPGRRDIDLRGDAKKLFIDVSKMFGLDVIFDGDYQAGQQIRFRVQDVDYRDALRALQAATGSFLVPLSSKLALVVKDTQQKRTEQDPTVALTLSLPEPVSTQEAQELARTVQQVMEIQKFAVDSNRRLVMIKDRVSKVRPAQLLFQQLLYHRAQVMVDVELIDINTKANLTYGMNLQTGTAALALGRQLATHGLRLLPTIPTNYRTFLAFGGGMTWVGVALTQAEAFSSMTKSFGETLLSASVRAVDGTPATVHIGDRYPIQQNAYLGSASGTGTVYTPPPQVTFEDLGLVLKVTPRIHSPSDVTLLIEAEFKVLSGPGGNGIPIIANRKLNSTVRLQNGEWAVVGGLLTSSEARTVSGIAGLGQIPFLRSIMRQTIKDSNKSEALVVIKPHVLDFPLYDGWTPAIWTGSESRPLTSM